jgi:hypothetical protein
MIQVPVEMKTESRPKDLTLWGCSVYRHEFKQHIDIPVRIKAVLEVRTACAFQETPA